MMGGWHPVKCSSSACSLISSSVATLQRLSRNESAAGQPPDRQHHGVGTGGSRSGCRRQRCAAGHGHGCSGAVGAGPHPDIHGGTGPAAGGPAWQPALPAQTCRPVPASACLSTLNLILCLLPTLPTALAAGGSGQRRAVQGVPAGGCGGGAAVSQHLSCQLCAGFSASSRGCPSRGCPQQPSC